MYCRLRLIVNRLRENVTKTSNFCIKSSRHDSIIARRLHESACRIITAEKIREGNLAYADLFADCKSVQSDSNKFPTQIRSELLHSNLESLPSWRYNKLMKDSDKKRREIRQLMRKLLAFESLPEKYRLSYLQDLPENGRDEIESDLFDFQHILDPSYKIKVSRDIVGEVERQMQRDKFDNDASGPIMWNIIF